MIPDSAASDDFPYGLIMGNPVDQTTPMTNRPLFFDAPYYGTLPQDDPPSAPSSSRWCEGTFSHGDAASLPILEREEMNPPVLVDLPRDEAATSVGIYAH